MENLIGEAASKENDSVGVNPSESINVLVRVRPLPATAVDRNTVVDILDAYTLTVSNSDGTKSFQCTFDSVLGPEASQFQVYSTVQHCTKSVLEGFNRYIAYFSVC